VSGRRLDVLRTLQESGGPLSIGEIARQLGVHVNTARFHLEALTGTGAAPAPALSTSPVAVDFGSQLAGAASAPRTVTLRNTGTGPLTFAATPFAMTGANAPRMRCVRISLPFHFLDF